MSDRPEIRPWRVTVFLCFFVAFGVCFDVTEPDMWINVPVGMAYGLFFELLVLPTFGLRWAVGELRECRREMRRLRSEMEEFDA